MLRSVRLPEGAVVEVAEYGDPDGRPVVLHPGTPATAATGGVVAEAAARHGVRLVAVSRPGYGASTAAPPGLAYVAELVGLLAGELGLERFGVWGMSGGGPFALAQGAVTPHLVSRVVVGAGPAGGEPEDVSALTAEALEMSSLFAGLDDDALFEVMSGQAPPGERYFTKHPDQRPAFLSGLRLAVARPDGYVRDNLSWGGEWDVALDGIVVPVDLVYGEADRMVTLDNGRRLADAMPHADLRILPGAGHGDATFGAADLALSLLSG